MIPFCRLVTFKKGVFVTKKKVPVKNGPPQDDLYDIIDHTEEVMFGGPRTLLECNTLLRSSGFFPARLTPGLWVSRGPNEKVSRYLKVVFHQGTIVGGS